MVRMLHEGKGAMEWKTPCPRLLELGSQLVLDLGSSIYVKARLAYGHDHVGKETHLDFIKESIALAEHEAKKLPVIWDAVLTLRALTAAGDVVALEADDRLTRSGVYRELGTDYWCLRSEFVGDHGNLVADVLWGASELLASGVDEDIALATDLLRSIREGDHGADSFISILTMTDGKEKLDVFEKIEKIEKISYARISYSGENDTLARDVRRQVLKRAGEIFRELNEQDMVLPDEIIHNMLNDHAEDSLSEMLTLADKKLIAQIFENTTSI